MVRVDVADIAKPIGAQQRLADILRGETMTGSLPSRTVGGLRRRLGRLRALRRKDTGGAGPAPSWSESGVEFALCH